MALVYHVGGAGEVMGDDRRGCPIGAGIARSRGSRRRGLFAGTRVPVVSLVDWLEGGYGIDEYLNSCPSVRREQAIATPEILKEALLTE